MGYQPTSTNNQPGFHFRLPHIESFFQDGEVPIKCTGDYLHHGFHLLRVVLNCKVTVWHLACGFWITSTTNSWFTSKQLQLPFLCNWHNPWSQARFLCRFKLTCFTTDITVQHSYDLVKPWGWSLLASALVVIHPGVWISNSEKQ